jgi:hypothetical protein
MAEAHGVGSSIPMVSYTGLSQQEVEDGMNKFYAYLNVAKINIEDKELHEHVAHSVSEAYTELHGVVTGEFGGYEPFEAMVEHTPVQVTKILLEME